MWDQSCKAECPSAALFNRGSSSSYKSDGKTFDTGYVVTDISGEVGHDTITVGDYTVPAQEFGVTTGANGTTFEGKQVAGVLGLSWPVEGGKYPSSTPWWQHALSGQDGSGAAAGEKWPEPVFGIELRSTDRNSGGSHAGGKLTLGGVDDSAIVGGAKALNYLPLSREGTWAVRMDDVVVGGASVAPKGDDGKPVALDAVLDSGTTGIMGPKDVVKGVYDKIPGAFLDEKVGEKGKLEYYRYPCEASPDVELMFGGQGYAIEEQDMWIYRNKHNETSTEETCLGNVFAWDG